MSSSRPPPRADAVVAGVGARSHNGLTALQVTMSVRAGKMDPCESHIIDRHGEPVGVCRLMCIGDRVQGLDRFVALGAPALRQAVFPWLDMFAQRGQTAPELPVILSLPDERRPGLDPRLPEEVFQKLAERARVPLARARSSLVFACRGGGVTAFEQAIARLKTGDVEAVAVGGIDSYFDPDILEHLDAEMRLHGLETENGFIPGEGAAFLLMTTRRGAGSLTRYAEIKATATALEPRPFGSSEPCFGLGMTAAVKNALAGVADGSIAWVLTDVANERHRVEEWEFAEGRNHRAMSADVIHDQPLLMTGEIGSASAAMLVAIAATRFQTGCAEASRALIAVHSDGPERGAMLIEQETSP
ncbi:MAG: hypothetical protein HUU21_05515 [Polyangiaceae bacterium]|nr:hypothetical protein [Polyangiaceae bacterium]